MSVCEECEARRGNLIEEIAALTAFVRDDDSSFALFSDATSRNYLPGWRKCSNRFKLLFELGKVALNCCKFLIFFDDNICGCIISEPRIS
jgi:hypothetical protein